MHNRRQQAQWDSRQERLWNGRAQSDLRRGRQRSALENREHRSATVFVKGRQWYAKTLLKAQRFPNSRAASRELIKNSRKLLEQSRHAVIRTRNILAFSRVQKFIN
jgi:uracil-DNA glycosylase